MKTLVTVTVNSSNIFSVLRKVPGSISIYDTIQYHTIRYNTTQYHIIRYDAISKEHTKNAEEWRQLKHDVNL